MGFVGFTVLLLQKIIFRRGMLPAAAHGFVAMLCGPGNSSHHRRALRDDSADRGDYKPPEGRESI